MENLQIIKNFYETAFRALDSKRAAPTVEIEFYNYVGLRHTIRVRDGKVFVRLSDLSQDAPLAAHESLAFILVAKLLRKRVPANHAENYRNYAAEMSDDISDARRTRGRKIISSARGAIYDLEEIFARLNRNYFADRITKPVLSWSQRRTHRIFGHHDALHDTIIISRSLDDARIPQFVAEFVLYHELLHIVHPTTVVNGKRRIHTAAFRRDERRFPQFDAAEKWLEKIAGQKRNQPQINTDKRG